MKYIDALAILVIAAAVLTGVYVGGWLMFVGGIVQIIEGIKADPVSALDIAVGALRFVCAGITGIITGIVALFGYSWLVDKLYSIHARRKQAKARASR